MIVCICNSITDAMIRTTIRETKSTSVDDVKLHLSICNCCEQCYDEISDMIMEEIRETK